MSRIDEMLDYLESLLNEIIVLETGEHLENREALAPVYTVATILMSGLSSHPQFLTEEQFYRSQSIVRDYQDRNPRLSK